jgi:hypothetical protein
MSEAESRRLPLVERGGGHVTDVRSSYAALPSLLGRTDLCRPGDVLVVRLSPPGGLDVGTVGALARLVLRARRRGVDLRVCAPDDDLARLAELMGLCDELGLRG